MHRGYDYPRASLAWKKKTEENGKAKDENENLSFLPI